MWVTLVGLDPDVDGGHQWLLWIEGPPCILMCIVVLACPDDFNVQEKRLTVGQNSDRYAWRRRHLVVPATLDAPGLILPGVYGNQPVLGMHALTFSPRLHRESATSR